MDIKVLDDIAERIATTRAEKLVFEGKVKEARAALEEKMANHLKAIQMLETQEEELRQKMTEALKEAKKDSWKTDKVTVSRQSSVTFKVTDEAATIAFLEQEQLDGEYVERKVNKLAEGVFSKRYERGEVTPGVSVNIKDFVRVTDRKQGEKE